MLKSPYPYFGGKSIIAPLIWERLGDVDNFVDPFFGSNAMLLSRPDNHTGRTETINDLDGYVANFWRALQAAPEETARHADYPVNEIDLTARHLWLVNEGREIIRRCWSDPDFYDAKVAGWWVWGISCWIGGGWCKEGGGPWIKDPETGLLVKGNAGKGVNRQRPHLGSAGQGVNRKLESLIGYFLALSDRMRGVRVCSGDWRRVVTQGALSHSTTIGVILDPPYSREMRDGGIYNHESDCAGEVLQWCIENGDNPSYRIALCGYDGEHNELERRDWSVLAWKAGASYQNNNGNGANKTNRHKERVWFSPACLRPAQAQLFEMTHSPTDDSDQEGAKSG